MRPDVEERRPRTTHAKAALWWVSLIILISLVGLFAMAASTRSWRYLGAGLPAAQLPNSESFVVALVLLAALGAVVMLVPPWRRLTDVAPLTRLMLASSFLVLFLGLSAFAPCVDRASAPLKALTATLSLFFGEGSTELFGEGAVRCQGSPPLAYEVARLLGVITALSAALRVLSQFYRDAVDRLGVRRARQIDVVIGSGPGIADLVRGLQRETSRRSHRIAVLGLALSDEEVATVRRAGALVVRTDAGSERGLIELPGQRALHKVGRMTVVGEDAAANLALARDYLHRRRTGDATTLPRRPVQVEVGNAFEAGLLRKQLLNAGNFDLDVFSRDEVAAREIAQLAFARFHRLVIAGRSPLADAILREVHEAMARCGIAALGDVVLAGEIDDDEGDRASMSLPAARRFMPRHASLGGSALGSTFGVALVIDLATSVADVENLGEKDLVVILPDLPTDVATIASRAANRAGATVLTYSEQSHGLGVDDHIGPRAEMSEPWGLRKVITYGLNLTERSGPPRTLRERLLEASLWLTEEAASAQDEYWPDLLDGLC